MHKCAIVWGLSRFNCILVLVVFAGTPDSTNFESLSKIFINDFFKLKKLIKNNHIIKNTILNIKNKVLHK